MRHNICRLFAMAFFCLAALLPAVTQTTVTTPGGTTNSIPKFTGSSTIGNSAITESAGNVGIGTTSPAYNLDVNSADTDSWIGISSAASSANTGILLNSKNGGVVNQAKISADWNGNLVFSPANLTLDYGSGSNGAYLNLTGRNNGTANNASIFANYTGGISLNPSAASPVVGVLLNPSSGAAFQVGGSAAVGYPSNQVAPSNGLIVNGYVGIGTTSPQYALDVNGTIRTPNGIVFGDKSFLPSGHVGTITGVLPGSGLTGGGYVGNVTLGVDSTVPRNNAVNYYSLNQIFNAGIEVWHGSLLHNSLGGDVIEATCGAVYGGYCLVLNAFGNLTASGVMWATDFRKFGSASPGLALDALGPGDVLVVDPNTDGTFTTTATPYSPLVAGIYAVDGPSQEIAKSQGTLVPIVSSGIAPCKVTDENGPINIGDLLVSSSTPGFAMRGTDKDRLHGAMLGKANGKLPSGKGAIKVLVTLQ